MQKDEIKEILDNFKDYEKRYKQYNEIQFIIFYRDIHLLLDYITNLQEELKSANESISWWSNRFKAVERDNKNYKSRNKKAIEYIEERKNLNWYADGVFVYELLNILNGGDEE